MKNIDSLVLEKGSHPTADSGLCAMEFVAFLAGEKHSDHPQCASPVLAAYVRGLNDAMTDDQRQRLKPYLPRLLNTVNSDLDLERAKILAWASITRFAPAALDAVGLVDHAASLRRLDQYDWAGAERVAQSAQSAAKSAWYAEYAAQSAEYTAWSAKYAAQSAESAAWSAKSAWSAECTAWSAEYTAWSAEYTAKSAARSVKCHEYAQSASTVDVWGLALSALGEALNVK